MLARLLRPVRRWRAAHARWSAADDRTFHDGLFQRQDYDPFSPSYAGYITIRRFADLLSPYLAGDWHVLDLGCGPGEITCELARRFPRADFLGVDHSASAVARAHENAARLALTNVRFEQADVATFVPARPPALVAMFDAFHHLVDPAGFVRRMSAFTDRFFLIEPAGDPLGRWRRALDFDWVAGELDKIRARIEHQVGPHGERSVASAAPAATGAGRAVEHRYPLEDYRTLFADFALEARGTVAGMDVYPPDPAYDSPWRRELMSSAYRLLIQIDDALLEAGQDEYAKHWAIYATTHASELRLPSRSAHRPAAALEATDTRIAGPYDAAYAIEDDALVLAADVTTTVALRVVNRSWRGWSSDAVPPIRLSYHWLDRERTPVIYDGLRTPLPGTVPPGETVRVAMTIHTPPRPGRYLLEIDLVEEGVTWFSGAGIPPLRVPVRVRPARRS